MTTGITYTCTPTASGDLIFSPAFNTGVPAEPAGNLKLDVWVGTTGYTTDSLTSTFDVIPGGSYDLEESGGWAVEPSSDKRRNLVVSKASRLCGTVYDGTGAPMAQAAVRIRCPNTEWSSIVTTNAAGLFVHSAVPVETYSYYVEPLGGADYVSTPVNRLVTVSAAGLTYNKDQTAADMKFNMVAVNAEIKGQVYHPAGTKASTGVLVIATTYAGGGAFPTKLPATSLANTFSYSTITMTDGAYSLKVASGIGQYYLYAYLVDNGVAKLLATPAGPVTVNSAAPVVQDLVVP